MSSGESVVLIMQNAQNYIQNYLWQNSQNILSKLSSSIYSLPKELSYFDKEEVLNLQKIHLALNDYDLILKDFDSNAYQILQSAVEKLKHIYLIYMQYDQSFFSIEFLNGTKVLNSQPYQTPQHTDIIYQLYLPNHSLDFKLTEKKGYSFTQLTLSDKSGCNKNIVEFCSEFCLSLSAFKDNYAVLSISLPQLKVYKYTVITALDNPENVVQTQTILATFNPEVDGIYFSGYDSELQDPLALGGFFDENYKDVEVVFYGLRLFSFSGQRIMAGDILSDEHTTIYARYISVNKENSLSITSEVYGINVKILDNIDISYYDTINQDVINLFIHCPMIWAARVNTSFDFTSSFNLTSVDNAFGTEFFIALGSSTDVSDSKTFYWFDMSGNLIAASQIFYQVKAYITHTVSFFDKNKEINEQKIQVLDGNSLTQTKEFLENKDLNLPIGLIKNFFGNDYIFAGYFFDSQTRAEQLPITKGTSLIAVWLEKLEISPQDI